MNKRKGLSIACKFAPDRDEGPPLLPRSDAGAKPTFAEVAAVALRNERAAEVGGQKMRKGRT
jgi:hypothetical protein